MSKLKVFFIHIIFCMYFFDRYEIWLGSTFFFSSFVYYLCKRNTLATYLLSLFLTGVYGSIFSSYIGIGRYIEENILIFMVMWWIPIIVILGYIYIPWRCAQIIYAVFNKNLIEKIEVKSSMLFFFQNILKELTYNEKIWGVSMIIAYMLMVLFYLYFNTIWKKVI